MRLANLSTVVTFLIAAGCQTDKKGGGAAPDAASAAARLAGSPAGHSLEGPYTHENLAIYTVAGSATDGREFITLDEGLAAGTVSVREQGAAEGRDRAQVNTLEVENRSDQWLFIQAGDVIKGGKQDRTFGIDLTLAPHSPPEPVQAFCVEHGRWSQVGGGLGFSANTAIVSGNDLKLAIQARSDQGEVWKHVALAEARVAALSSAETGSVTPTAGRASGGQIARAPAVALDDLSGSSTGTYNAIVENRKVQEDRDRCVEALLPRVQGDAKVGMVVVVNGEVRAADVYGSPALFRKLSRKLLESYALEAALARGREGTAAALPQPPTAEDVQAFLVQAESPQGRSEAIGPRMHRSTRETPQSVLYEYVDGEPAAEMTPVPPALHRTYLKK